MSAPMRRGPLVALLAISTPASLGFETAIRKALFNADMRYMRVIFNPYLTPVAWALLGVTCVAVILAVPVHRVIYRRSFARLGARVDDPVARASADTMALYIASSVVQFPTLLATVTFTLGADVLPVFTALWAAALGVMLIGVFGPRAT